MTGEPTHTTSKEMALHAPATNYHLKSEVSITLCCQLCIGPTYNAQNFTYYVQALCLISHVLLINLQLWAPNKWLKCIFALQNACDKKSIYSNRIVS